MAPPVARPLEFSTNPEPGALKLPYCGEPSLLLLLPAQHSVALSERRDTYMSAEEYNRTPWMEDDKTVHVPGRAVQANRLQVLFHTLVVMDLSWDRNGRCVAAEFCRLAAHISEKMKQNKLDTEDVVLQITGK